MAVRLSGPKFYVDDDNGNPLVGGKVYFYEAGSFETLKDTFTGEETGVANPNPVILNAAGYASIFLEGSYNIQVYDADDVLVWTEENISSNNDQEWIGCGAATYDSPTSFVVSGNKTAQYTAGRRVRMFDGLSYVYSTVLSSSFSSQNTTVALVDASVPAGIVQACYAIISSGSLPEINNEWVDCRGFTRNSSTSFTLEGDQTATFDQYRSVRFQDPILGFLYSYITDVTLVASNTQITVQDPVVTTDAILVCRSIVGDVSIQKNTFANVAALTAESIYAGRIVETNSWAAPVPPASNKGGAKYQIYSSANYQTLTGNPAPDGYADHLLANGNVARLITDIADVSQCGALGDGSTDDSDSIQGAINYVKTKGGGKVRFTMTGGGGDFRVTATKGTNDKYGININSSNISLEMEHGCQLRRLSSDISTYALSFPILLIGKPDSNLDADQITNIAVNDVKFYGEDTRHAISGAAIMDGRQAVWLKNLKGVTFRNCKFNNIDSSAIYAQNPGMYDYENGQFYNTTKCYDIEIANNRFQAEEHATNGRALLHAVVANSDRVRLVDNDFVWCDDCLSCSTTYDDYDQDENDTYTNTNLGVAVRRTGKGYVVKGNTCYNSSEHAFYLEGMNITCVGNALTVDNTTVCNTSQIQSRGRSVTIADNNLTGVFSAINISTGSMDVTCTGNAIQAFGDTAGGIVNIQSDGLTSYINGRSDYFQSYKPARNIVFANNTIDMPNAAQTNGVAIRVYTSTSDANFPDGQMQNVIIKGNAINRPRKAILTLAPMIRNCMIKGNIFNGKDFTESGFSVGTTMDSEYVLGVDDSLSTSLLNFSFDDNTVYGFENILFDDGGAGAAGTFQLPYGIRNNRFSYVKVFSTAAFLTPGVLNRFTNNTGIQFLDRTRWTSNNALFNALSGGAGSNPEFRSQILIVSSTDVRAYYDDNGGFKAL